MGELAVAIGVGVLVAIAVRLVLFVPRRTRIRELLDAHTRAFAPPTRQRKGGLGVGELFARTDAAFGETKVWRRLAELLDRSPVKLGPAPFLYLSLALSLGLGLLSAIAAFPTAAILVALFVGAIAPYTAVLFAAARRMRSFDDHLPDMLDALSGLLRGGQGLQQALASVARDGRPPMSTELSRALGEVELGLTVTAALQNMADRVDSRDLDFVVTAITIQSQIGGSLATLFEQISQTVRERRQFARRVQAFTATGRLSAYVLGGMPLFVIAALSLLGGDYLKPLVTTGAGVLLDVLALSLLLAGALSLKRIVSFRV